MTNVPGVSTRRRPVLENQNTNFGTFLQRAKVNSSKQMFSAGFIVDPKNENVLLVLDRRESKDPTKQNKPWYKMPGGVPDEELKSFEVFVKLLEEELRGERAKRRGDTNVIPYPTWLINQILAHEKKEYEKGNRNVPIWTLILEVLEETQYYAIKFSYRFDGYKYNWNTEENDLWQVYFIITAVISKNSKSFEDKIREFHNVRTATATDLDVLNMRVITPLEKLGSKIEAPAHKIAAAEIIGQQAMFFFNKIASAKTDEEKKTFTALHERFKNALRD